MKKKQIREDPHNIWHQIWYSTSILAPEIPAHGLPTRHSGHGDKKKKGDITKIVGDIEDYIKSYEEWCSRNDMFVGANRTRIVQSPKILAQPVV